MFLFENGLEALVATQTKIDADNNVNTNRLPSASYQGDMVAKPG